MIPAAEKLRKVMPLMMTAAGTINPPKVVVMAPGFAGMKNTLFESDRTLMVFGSAKEVVNGIVDELGEQ